ncbi:MAG: hypothetical protein WBF96_09665, partial [Phycisphaerae bacterium]
HCPPANDVEVPERHGVEDAGINSHFLACHAMSSATGAPLGAKAHATKWIVRGASGASNRRNRVN